MVLSEREASTFNTAMSDWLASYYHQQQQIDAVLPERPAQSFAAQLQVLYDNPVAVAGFTFGIISAETRLTRLFSGKQACALINDYLREFAPFDNANNTNNADSANSANSAGSLPAYPQLNAMTGAMRAHAGHNDDVEHLSLWAGQGVTLIKREPTLVLLERLVAEL